MQILHGKGEGGGVTSFQLLKQSHLSWYPLGYTFMHLFICSLVFDSHLHIFTVCSHVN